MNDLVGREMLIYPGDAETKHGILLEVHDHGVLFEITHYTGRDKRFVVGKQYYISYSARLAFCEL